MAEVLEQERDAELAAMDVSAGPDTTQPNLIRRLQPRNPLSPNAISPGGTELEENPFDSEFNEFEDACFDRNIRGSEVRGRDRPDPPISTLDMKSGVSTDSKSWCVAAKSMFAADINRRLAGAV